MPSRTIEEQFDRVEEFNSLLGAAELNAATTWEEEFTADLRANFQRYGPRMFLSESQQTTLERIANQ
ncbi:TPA: hypothetical protein ACKR1B_000128 [Pseudomonas aeruginosa]|uniref:hypothetical protein n=1 Tax=Pseudomonas aeruginosa TaxID=287 RepID=UPI0002CAD645|nr:hypothetical protein [Pseudomonas aeruginosa]AMU00818.1 hypothetical protein OB07_02459 [Pseudomonas aeruginosa]EKW2904507.1 hypothetical protein [Pseudomonas aeruginosa]ENH93611.1 hypothetical protein H734_09127 [Pseudomonas aeruginosa PA45]KSC68006.1 hypothetical protein AO888_23600 [Pseudomonas aeruginosa]MBG6952725.1 hypothetical protein [Pseudomonas aeruginosa]